MPRTFHLPFRISINPVCDFPGEPVTASSLAAGGKIVVVFVKGFDNLPWYQCIAGVIKINRRVAIVPVVQ
jgi:hypothetical protein